MMGDDNDGGVGGFDGGDGGGGGASGSAGDVVVPKSCCWSALIAEKVLPCAMGWGWGSVGGPPRR